MGLREGRRGSAFPSSKKRFARSAFRFSLPLVSFPQCGRERLQEGFLLLLQDVRPFHRPNTTVSPWKTEIKYDRFTVDKFMLDKGFPHPLWF
jgi:hypothetical protein